MKNNSDCKLAYLVSAVLATFGNQEDVTLESSANTTYVDILSKKFTMYSYSGRTRSYIARVWRRIDTSRYVRGLEEENSCQLEKAFVFAVQRTRDESSQDSFKDMQVATHYLSDE